MQFITKKYDPKYKEHKCEIEDERKKEPIRSFLGEDLALVVIMDCMTVEAHDLKMRLRFNLHDIFNTKEQTAVGQITKALEGENRQTQSNFLGYRIDLNFHDYKLAIEVDEYGYCDGNATYEIQRQTAIEKELGREFIRINTDESSNNIFKTINEIHRKIKTSSKESLIDRISRRLSELELKLKHSIKSKALKHAVKKILSSL